MSKIFDRRKPSRIRDWRGTDKGPYVGHPCLSDSEGAGYSHFRGVRRLDFDAERRLYTKDQGEGGSGLAGTSDTRRLPSSLLAHAAGLRGDLVRLRRAVHRHPELGFEERNTCTLVRQTLENLAPKVTCRSIVDTGILATIPAHGPAVLLRACLDALPIDDGTDVEYASEVAGVSHACGHDGQIAILVGALVLLSELIPGVQVHGLFQPAEEIDTGARAILDSGLLDDLQPELTLGFHGHPDLDAGTIGVSPGPVMGSITTIRCRVVGRGGHGAAPHLTSDALTAAAAIVLDWQVALSRRIDPRQPAVLSVGRLASGVTENVVPGEAEIDATMRCLDPAIEDELSRVVADVARGVEAWSGTVVDLSVERVVPAVVNDPVASRLVADATIETLGRSALVDATAMLGGDDFAWLLNNTTGCYFFIGERQQDRPPYGWHDPAYDLDEESLVYGSAVLAAAAARVREGGST